MTLLDSSGKSHDQARRGQIVLNLHVLQPGAHGRLLEDFVDGKLQRFGGADLRECAVDFQGDDRRRAEPDGSSDPAGPAPAFPSEARDFAAHRRGRLAGSCAAAMKRSLANRHACAELSLAAVRLPQLGKLIFVHDVRRRVAQVLLPVDPRRDSRGTCGAAPTDRAARAALGQRASGLRRWR